METFHIQSKTFCLADKFPGVSPNEHDDDDNGDDDDNDEDYDDDDDDSASLCPVQCVRLTVRASH